MYELHGVFRLVTYAMYTPVTSRAYANPIVVCVSSARGELCTILHQIDWRYSDSALNCVTFLKYCVMFLF